MRSNDFAVGSWVIYPSHGVGKLEKIEKITIDGSSIDMFVISFGKSGLTLKIPVTKAISAGLRHTMSKDALNNVYDVLKKKIKKKKTMWSKRAQDYETKINSGDLSSIASVVRELYKEGGEIMLSFSERQVYNMAMERLAKEFSIIENIGEEEAVTRLEEVMKAA